MKKCIKHSLLIIVGIIVFLAFGKIIYLKKVDSIYKRKILEKYGFTLELTKVKCYKDKTNNKKYILSFKQKDGFNYKAIVKSDDILNDKSQKFSLNITDVEFAKKLQQYYGKDYEILQVVKTEKRAENDVLKDGKYDECYSFCVKSYKDEKYIKGLIPKNQNIEEMFDFGKLNSFNFE